MRGIRMRIVDNARSITNITYTMLTSFILSLVSADGVRNTGVWVWIDCQCDV